MLINIIAAIAANNAIGLNNQLLYHIKADMKRFKELTTGHTIIMGRKTYDSLPKGALPNRRNIVLSRSVKALPGCDVFPSLQAALAACSAHDNIFLIGGESVYKEGLAIAHHLYLTEVEDTPAQADAFFPSFDKEEWQITSSQSFPAEDGKPAYKFVDYCHK